MILTLIQEEFSFSSTALFWYYLLLQPICCSEIFKENAIVTPQCEKHHILPQSPPCPSLKFTLKVSSSEVVSVNSALMPFQKMFSLLLKLLIGLLKVWNKTLISQLRLCKVWPPGIIWTQSSIWWHCLRPGKGVVTRARKWRYICRCVKTQW